MSDDREQRLVDAVYGEGSAAPADEAEAARLRAFREGLARRLDAVEPPAGLRARLVAEARARVRARRPSWVVWATRLAPVATVVLIVGAWITLQPRLDRGEQASPERAVAEAAAAWGGSKTPAVSAPAAPPVAPVGEPKPVGGDSGAADGEAKLQAVAQRAAATTPAEVAGPPAASAEVEVAAKRARLKKEVERHGILTTPGKGSAPRERVADVVTGSADLADALTGSAGVAGGAGALEVRGRGYGGGGAGGELATAGGATATVGIGDLGRRGGAGEAGGTGWGRLGTGKAAASKADADEAGATGSRATEGLVSREAEATGEAADAPPAAARAQAVASQPLAEPVSPAAAPAPMLLDRTAARDDAAEQAAEEKNAEAPRPAPRPSAGHAASASPAPDDAGSCRSLETALARATTATARVDATLALAECRARAGARDLARRLLEDLLDDTTLAPADRARVAEALEKL